MGEKWTIVVRKATSTILVLLLICFLPVLADDLPGGELEYRAALLSEEGSHPKIIVQTVPDATTTATCLVMRYAEAGKSRSPAGVAHLLEHLLFRSRSGQKPGALLLRNELLGDSCRAWITPTAVVFSEVVPADNGLDSLKLQLSRLKQMPVDDEGLTLEKKVILKEIVSVDSPEEQARRKILASFGLEPNVEGQASTLSAIDREQLESCLEQLDLESDVVIAVVGPHSSRDVRKVLSSTLSPLVPKRSEPRESSLAPVEEVETLSLPSSHAQTSYFFNSGDKDLRVFRVAELLAEVKLGKGSVALEKEGGALVRLDVSADAPAEKLLEDLTPEQSKTLFQRLHRDWLDRYESQQTRAEMLALAEIYGKRPEEPVREAEFPILFGQAKELLRSGLEAKTKIVLKPTGPGKRGLYSFKSRAYRSLPEVKKDKLPNGIGITTQRIDSFPLVAVAGFFRLAPALDSRQIAVLEEALGKGSMTYQVTPNGIFFQNWAPADQCVELLNESARELKEFAGVKDFQTNSAPSPSLFEEFFIPGLNSESEGKLKGSRLFRPESAHLVVVGPVDPAEMDRGLRPAWSGWFSDNTPPGFSKPRKLAAGDSPTGKVISAPAGSQPALVLGFTGPARSSPDFLPFNLAIQTLAGRPNTSVLARKLQAAKLAVTSVKAFPLSASETLDESSAKQVWLIAVRPAEDWSDPEQAAGKITSILKGLGTQPIGNHELDLTRDFLKSSLALSASTIRGRAKVLAHSEFYRLSDSYLEDYAGLYDHLSPELVKAICGNYLQDPQIRWLYFQPGKAE